MIKSSQLVNGNSAVELYSKNNGGLSTDGQLLSGVCDLCDGKNKIIPMHLFYRKKYSMAS